MLHRRVLCIFMGLLILSVAAALSGCASGGESAPLGTPTYTQEQELGKLLFAEYCSSCHSRIPEDIIVGPSLAGIAGRAKERIEGMSGREYLESSINNPGGYLVEGYDDLMPETLAAELNQKEVKAIIAYLMTLQD